MFTNKTTAVEVITLLLPTSESTSESGYLCFLERVNLGSQVNDFPRNDWEDVILV